MSSLKAFFCDVCVILVVGLLVCNVARAEEKNISPSSDAQVSRGNCTCAGFPSNVTEAGSEPLISQSPGLEVRCDDEGESTCKELCVALATAAKAKGPEVICQRLKNADELKLSAFSKICDRPWLYANMTAEEPLCCTEGNVKLCASAEKDSQANSTLTDVVDSRPIL